MRTDFIRGPGGETARPILFRIVLSLALVFTMVLGGQSVRAADETPPLMQDYCSVLVTYACHAKSLWHGKPTGGYWGDGLDAKNQNGAVRGTCNTLLTYAMLVKALDSGWVHPNDVKSLKHADLDREKMIECIRLNLAYLVAHHKSGSGVLPPKWGYNWQSSLWMQSLGMGALLTWGELGDELKAGIKVVAAAEADWVCSHPPKDFNNGDTGAEENGWNTGAPAVALAVMPEATSATVWWRTLKVYAANTYSHKSDKQSSGSVADGAGAMVSTANLNDDWSLVNHKFFHPDYVQVSGMHLGEALLITKLGDGINGTDLAEELRPFAMHNVAEVWSRVLRPLLLPTGEFAYPAGNDWTYHCSTNQGYFAFIATALSSYDAAEAEVRGLEHVKARRELGPTGRLLGDSNLEWWWEPLVCKRICTAMLHHMYDPGVPRKLAEADAIDGMTTTTEFPSVNIWMHRTPEYFFSVSNGKAPLGYYVPMGGTSEGSPYMTLPVNGGLLPEGPWEFQQESGAKESDVVYATMKSDGKNIGAVVCLPNSVTVLSRKGFGAMGVENDTLTDPGRTIKTIDREQLVPGLKKGQAINFSGKWVCIDEGMGMISPGGFEWKPAGCWSQRSVAMDKVKPLAKSGVWQMMAGDSEKTAAVAKALIVTESAGGIDVILQDGMVGTRYKIRMTDAGLEVNRL